MPSDVDVAQDPEPQLREACQDLCEPVARVLALSAAALAEPGLDTGVRRRLRQIAGQARWLAEIIRDAQQAAPRDTGRGGAGRGGAGREAPDHRADVVRIAGWAVAACRLTWPGEVSMTSPPRPVRCGVPAVLLRRVVVNMLSNATRAAGPSGEVTVEIRRDQGLTVLTVEDSGPGFGGIPTGHGIGLAAAARNVARYGGRVERGRGTAGGARVSLWLP